MTARHTATLGLLLWSVTFVVAGAVRAESATCVEGSVLWSAPVAQAGVLDELPASVIGDVIAPVAAIVVPDALPADSVPWCVDAADPRCSPDPTGEQTTRLLRTGAVGQQHGGLNVPAPFGHDLDLHSHVVGLERTGVVASLERPPRPPRPPRPSR